MHPATMPQPVADTIQDLADIVHDIAAPWVCGGSFDPAAPVTLHFRDGTELPVTKHTGPDQMEQLTRRCAPAPFGHGKKTLYRREVRDALQLKAGEFSVRNFDPAESGILEEVRKQLAPADRAPLTAELYNLNVYVSSGHFQPHKDTPRGSDMIGTLVVCLPSAFTHGTFVVSHHGVRREFHWAEDIRHQHDPARVHWAAFFGDIDHRIDDVWTGTRITLSYVLRRGEVAAEPAMEIAPQAERLQRRLEQALADRHFLPHGGTLGFPCFHMYTSRSFEEGQLDPLSAAAAGKLKGRDQMVAQAAMQAGLSVSLQPYLTESCAYETWQLRGFPTAAARRNLGRRVDPDMLASVLPIAAAAESADGFGVTWVDPPPMTYSGRDADEPEDEDPEEPAIRLFHECEYSATGYFGNEGSELEFYVYSALQVSIPPWSERQGRGEATHQAPPKRPVGRKPRVKGGSR